MNTNNGWLDIASAPKDESDIWAFNGEQGRMQWSEGDGWALWVWCDPLLSDVDPAPDQPTHWMPLPAAPGSPTEQPAYTVTVDPDPRGVSVGVYLGSSCVYHGAHPIPAGAVADEGEKAAIDWRAVEARIAEYAEDYELRDEDDHGREGCYQPNETERGLIIDAIHGLLADDEFMALIRPAAPAAGDARDAITLPIAAARMIRREYLPSNPRRMSHVAVRDAVEQFLCALQVAEAAIATSQQGGE